MVNKGLKRDELIKELLSGYLRTGITSSKEISGAHLDDDVLAAFVEGNLSERESGPVNSHLVACSFCRHRSAELLRLDLQFADDSQSVPEVKTEPTKVSDVLSGILGKIFGAGEGAVFAHEEKDNGEEEKEDGDKD